ncbi:hypothetical protein SELMODRAFT_90809 [Selaginella moellendorffii]|uniref:Glucose-methanol-choline oxidoreductase N-terminal domain-containing protein n=1 Tax=Selaginella moellendorffii TaxID=88036 RepID=D8RD51_SELML|nr:protein HOTHEAD [Selaginella moellendorffii]EFJ30252.1 hypothetical protein SELMODRAFT_90809 [Selaginella moellendorffii]|eukprot:XP_002969136.1 protein HOTHEAD [Selaginella moellendorffii]
MGADETYPYSFLRDAADSPVYEQYDYIIVGGGTAGCPLAATLSRYFRVLVLERGPSPYGNANITRIENFGRSLNDTEGQFTPAQAFTSTDGVRNTRPRVLGGGSCLNAGFYTRASPDYVRRVGWDARLVNQSYPWVERVVAFVPQLGAFQSAFRAGLLETGVTPDNGATFDHIYGTKTGGSIFDHQGNRHTAADLLRYATARNILVLLRASVQRILFDTSGYQPRAIGVQYRDANSRMHIARLNSNRQSQVILSAGAMGSPQLLMLNGIGPRAHLESMGIRVLVNLPGVGQGMADNPMNTVYLLSPAPVETSLIQVVGITHYGSFIEAGSGELDGLSAGVLLEKVIGPRSSGQMTLTSLDAADNPQVTFNYFQDPEDLQSCVEGINQIEEIILSSSMRRFRYDAQALPSGGTVASPVRADSTLRSSVNVTLASFCRSTVQTIWHYHGGCQVGRVVDSDYHVLGVDALRVIDGSTFNFSPGTNPQATVMMLGRYMGLRIIAERMRR